MVYWPQVIKMSWKACWLPCIGKTVRFSRVFTVQWLFFFQDLRNKAPAPPRNLNCEETTYGCCWDGVTTQHNYEGEGCPPCEDEKVFGALCGMWERHCHNSSRPVEHQVVRKHCHRTCNNCFGKCNYLPFVTCILTEIPHHTFKNHMRNTCDHMWKAHNHMWNARYYMWRACDHMWL